MRPGTLERGYGPDGLSWGLVHLQRLKGHRPLSDQNKGRKGGLSTYGPGQFDYFLPEEFYSAGKEDFRVVIS